MNLFIGAVVAAAAALLFSPWLLRARLWHATVTPLASIIGSGFLLLGPVLQFSYGALAPLVMLGLCLAAYLFGAAIRFNIAHGEGDDTASPGLRGVAALEQASSWALAFAYIISVAYYLNLLGAFSVSLTRYNDHRHAVLVTSAAYLVILGVGWAGGLRALERLQYLTVTTKLAVIAGLLAGLIVYFGQQAAGGHLQAAPVQLAFPQGLALAFGLIVTVQGFETSRYLGAEYDAATRIRSMRLSQGLSTLIYVVYIALFSYAFERGHFKLTETAIVDMMGVVAPVLPLLLVAGALAAQFSAAVADASGSGGLLAELTHHRLPPRQGYALLVALGLALTWSVNVFDIVSYASRAFALYYALQAAIAARLASGTRGGRWRVPAFGALAVLGLAAAVFGQAVAA
ncbi:MAG: hypothetical protein KF686_03655 [Ramlibacter sp.]|nr:hypothetical protein [Ramlibacter sp.]